ncbi:hypothetical protein [Nocardia brasiliensis]|uniref:hypothetical protein n=1 Tax=Nocardia brasiliensis TaxID=37326 RepID=UPI00366D4CBC
MNSARLHRPNNHAGRISLLIAALILAVACGAGQIAQTAQHRSSINGTNADAGHIALRNVYLSAEPVAEAPTPRYANVTLSFTAVNTSIRITDRLVSITSDAATTVTINADPAALHLPPGTAIAATQPIEQPDNTPAPDEPFTVHVHLAADAVRPAVPVPFTFVFEKAGPATFVVPFDISTPRQSSPIR